MVASAAMAGPLILTRLSIISTHFLYQCSWLYFTLIDCHDKICHILLHFKYTSTSYCLNKLNPRYISKFGCRLWRQSKWWKTIELILRWLDVFQCDFERGHGNEKNNSWIPEATFIHITWPRAWNDHRRTSLNFTLNASLTPREISAQHSDTISMNIHKFFLCFFLWLIQWLIYSHQKTTVKNVY